MAWVKSESGRRINTDHIADVLPQLGGAHRIRWSHGMVEVFSQTDGEAIIAAIDNEAKPATSAPRRKATTKK